MFLWTSPHCTRTIRKMVFHILYFNFNRKVDCNIVTNDKWTALQLGCHQGFLGTVKLLLQQERIDVNQGDARGTALHCAAKSGNAQIVSLLIMNNIDPRLLCSFLLHYFLALQILKAKQL